MVIRKTILLAALFFVAALPAIAEPTLSTPADPASDSESLRQQPSAETALDLEFLLQEAEALFRGRQSIDARAKLLEALRIAPEDYRAYMMLGSYYLGEVAHFQLAYKYLKTAETKFRAQFGNSADGNLKGDAWKAEARLLFLLSEARLNLDDYEGSLKTLDQFARAYWDDWYPGTRAWVLMKLRRYDDAILEAQKGLLRNADPTRTYNILGILLSLKGRRDRSLEAFKQAIKAELALGGGGQVATPLNNAGEVYRELFQDDYAESAWITALKMVDGCDHILPSLNLAIVYIDELRLFQAERALDDFEACFAERSMRQDSEHRALLALARGRIALRKGEIDRALELLTLAVDLEQWFGKIGTDVEDMRFAALSALGNALQAKAAAITDTEQESWLSSLAAPLLKTSYQVRAWWTYRQARETALTQLNDFEDLSLRNTDAMLEYPTLGNTLAGFPTESLRRRVETLKKEDPRKRAHGYYDLYLATNERAHGDVKSSRVLLSPLSNDQNPSGFRELDRLARAETLKEQILDAQSSRSWLFARNDGVERDILRMKNELFALLPSHIRTSDLSLPVSAQSSGSRAANILEHLLGSRFEVVPTTYADGIRYTLSVMDANSTLTLSLNDNELGKPIVQLEKPFPSTKAERVAVLNEFLDKVFHHRLDPPPTPLPSLDILPSMLRE